VKYKLLVVDVDGTLVGRDGSISTKDREALAEVRQLGIRVSLSTGRVTQACQAIINQLSLDGCHIFFDGALASCLIGGTEIYVQPLSQEVVKRAIESAHSNDIPLELYSATHYFVERETWSSDIRRQFFGIEPTVANFAELQDKERIIKGGLTTSSAQEIAKATSFCQEFADSLRFTWTKTPAYPDIDFINILNPKVSKGEALAALASYLGISLDEVVAIGDGPNDVSLLTSAGLAIAMDNSPDELKAVADYITLDIDHSGTAAAIERFLL
jgi:hypothetical protein